MHWLIFNPKNEILLTSNGNIPSGDNAPVEAAENHIFDLANNCKAFYYNNPAPQGFTFEWLRKAYHKLPNDLRETAFKASELVYFDSYLNYCPKCGGKMEYSSPISKKCVSCGNEIWPRINPAIIVLIYRGKDEILLSHALNFHGTFYGLTAGFLETGESLEQCVVREVMEETSLKIKNIRYFASQPWPYPSQEMFGFFAEYESGEIHIQEEELSDCRWFTRDALPEIPPHPSMARKLIDYWLDHRDEF